MSRYRLYPSPEQEAVLREHCAHARYVGNLAWNLHQFGTLETHGYPGRRKRYLNEGSRITHFTFGLHLRRLNRRWGHVRVPKVGWVRFRWTRAVSECRAGRWHVAFAVVPRKARARKDSPEQQAERARIARLRAREADRRKDWCEKVSTGLARRFDVIRFEDPASVREPQLLVSLTGRDAVGIPRPQAGEDVN